MTNKEKLLDWIDSQKKEKPTEFSIENIILEMGPMEYAEVMAEIYRSIPEPIHQKMIAVVRGLTTSSLPLNETTVGLVGSTWVRFHAE